MGTAATAIPQAGRSSRSRRRTLTIVGFLLPTVVLLVAVLAIPILWSIGLSFTEWNILTGRDLSFVGLQNYLDMFADDDFLASLKLTLVITAASLAFQFVVGFGTALALAREFRGRGTLTTLLALPMMIAPVVASLQWKWLLSLEYGLVNWALQVLGLSSRAWLSDPATVVQSLIMVDVWHSAPFVMLFLLAGLQSLPTDLYEAASLDGASSWRQLISVTLPMLTPVILVVMIYRSIFTFRMFDQIYVLTGGGPASMTETIAFFAYKAAFQDWTVGYGAAIAVVMLMILVLIGVAYLAVLKTEAMLD